MELGTLQHRAAAVEQFQLWRFLSFQFLHANGHHSAGEHAWAILFWSLCGALVGKSKVPFFLFGDGCGGRIILCSACFTQGFSALLRYRLVEVKHYLQAIYRWWVLPPAFLASWPALP